MGWDGGGGNIPVETRGGEEVWDVEQSEVDQAGDKIWSVKKMLNKINNKKSQFLHKNHGIVRSARNFLI